LFPDRPAENGLSAQGPRLRARLLLLKHKHPPCRPQAAQKDLRSMITLKDIAAECHVSVSTVSRALNGTDLISPEVTESIRAAAERMGYHPNEIARSLKLNRTGIIGILHDEAMDHPYFSGMLDAIRLSAEKRGYCIMMLSRKQQDSTADSSDTALSRRVDGIICVYADILEAGLDRVMRNQIPVVSVDDCNRPCPIVASDYENGTRLLTLEALRRSHRRIAFIHGESGISTDRRISGFRAAMASAGLQGELIPSRFYAGESCARLILNRLQQADAPTCFLLPDDTTALTVLSILRQNGLQVPRDVAVAGFDGQRWARILAPRLSTYRQDLQAIGEAALDTLFAAGAKGDVRSRSEIIIPGQLIPGETL
jgi:LacI family transcriptional regulator